MNDLRDGGRFQASAFENLFDTVEYAFLRCARGGEYFGAETLVANLQCEVGEGAADIDGEAGRGGHGRG